MGGRKVGVYLPSDVLEALERLRVAQGGASYSRVVQEALRLYLSERVLGDCVAVGFINVLYDHEKQGSDEALTDAQHRFMDVVLFASHVHVDERRCLLSIAVRGPSRRIEELVESVQRGPGILLTRPTLICL